ncbi:hypothetical protein TSOC_003968, partial [Tetrabaena socialis]
AKEALNACPLYLRTSFLLRAYGTDLRAIKWLLHYAAVRAAKEEFYRLMAGNDRAAAADVCVKWLPHCHSLGPLAPPAPAAGSSSNSGTSAQPLSPQAEFMVAEARGAVEGGVPDTLAAMQAAARSADRLGDDLVGWLAWLNVALWTVDGSAGGDFSEDEVLQALDAAAAQRSSAKRWGGDIILESRCRSLKASILQSLKDARAVAKPRADGRLPVQRPLAAAGVGPWLPLESARMKHRKCAGCHCAFAKAQACSGCKQVWYCGRPCQLQHWRSKHKAECAQMAAAVAAAGLGRQQAAVDSS